MMAHTKCIVCLQKSAEIPSEYRQFSNKLLIKILNSLWTKLHEIEPLNDITSFPFCSPCRVYFTKFAKLNDKLESLARSLCRLQGRHSIKILEINSLQRGILFDHDDDSQDRLGDSRNNEQKGEENIAVGLATSVSLQPNTSDLAEVEVLDNATTSELAQTVEEIEVVDSETDVASNSNASQSDNQLQSDHETMKDKMVSSDGTTGRGGNLDASQGRWVSKTVEQVSEKDFIWKGKYPFERTDSGLKCGTCATITKFPPPQTNYSWHYYMITHIRQWHLGSGRTRKQKVQQRFNEIAQDRFQYGSYVFEKNDGRWRCLKCDYLAAIGKGTDKFKYISFHINTKHENPGKHHMCEICGTQLSTSTALKLHKITQHAESNDSYPCSSCKKTYKTKTQAHLHEKQVHRANRSRFICEICGKAFWTKSNLQGHIGFVHNSQRIFKCKDCGKAYANLSSLSVHQNSRHTGKRKYICDLCGMNFSQPYSIKRHKMTAHKN